MRAPRRKFLRDHPGALATAQSTVSPGEDSGQKSELGKVMRPVLPVAVDQQPFAAVTGWRYRRARKLRANFTARSQVRAYTPM
jgi:hypothetical protein